MSFHIKTPKNSGEELCTQQTSTAKSGKLNLTEFDFCFVCTFKFTATKKIPRAGL